MTSILSYSSSATPPSRIELVTLQISHRCAAVAFFLLVASGALAFFHKDARLLLPLATIVAAIPMLAAALIWLRSRLLARRCGEAIGIFIFCFAILSADVTLYLLCRAGKL